MSATVSQLAIPVADIEIEDVRIAVIFLDSAFDSISGLALRAWQAELQSAASSQALAGSIVLVWRDRAGRKKFIAEPAQRPFFESLRYDQLFAQVNRTLTMPAVQSSDLSLPKL